MATSDGGGGGVCGARSTKLLRVQHVTIFSSAVVAAPSDNRVTAAAASSSSESCRPSAGRPREGEGNGRSTAPPVRQIAKWGPNSFTLSDSIQNTVKASVHSTQHSSLRKVV